MEETPPVTLLQCSKSCVPKPSPSKSFQYVPSQTKREKTNSKPTPSLTQQSNANRPFPQMSDGGNMNIGSKLLKLGGGSESAKRHCRRMKACPPTAATKQLWPQKGHVLRSEALVEVNQAIKA